MDEQAMKEMTERKYKVLVASQLMEKRLEDNIAKGKWTVLTPAQLLTNLREQVHELENAVNDQASGKNEGPESFLLIARKGADVCNYAMFIMDATQSLKIAEAHL